jgi:putative copper resistance protein D
MALDLQTAQRVATTVLNLSVALAAGASMASLWLATARSDWGTVRRGTMRRWCVGGLLAALPSLGAVLWLEAAAMAEVPLAQAGEAIHSLLASTHFGLAWSVGMTALSVAALLNIFLARQAPRVVAFGTLSALGVFWYTRSMVSHAASEGDFSFPLLVDWLHLALASFWVGEVAVAGLVALAPSNRLLEDDRRDRAGYVSRLSSSATVALAGVFLTGLYGAWRNLGGIEALLDTPYGKVLLPKLLFVWLAATLGGFNRFVVMPPWLSQEATGRAAGELFPQRFRLVLLVEAVVLLAALALAAIVASTSPPTAAM